MMFIIIILVMRHKINIQLLKQSQKFANKLKHPITQDIYENYYKIINKIYSDITKPFKKVCIHGNYPHLMTDNFKIKSKDPF